MYQLRQLCGVGEKLDHPFCGSAIWIETMYFRAECSTSPSDGMHRRLQSIWLMGGDDTSGVASGQGNSAGDQHQIDHELNDKAAW